MTTQWTGLDDGTQPERRDRKPLVMGLIAFGSVGLVALCGGVAVVVTLLVNDAPTTQPARAAQASEGKDKAKATAPPAKSAKEAPLDNRAAKKLAWIKEAEGELAEALANRLKEEPLPKPDFLTEAEYLTATNALSRVIVAKDVGVGFRSGIELQLRSCSATLSPIAPNFVRVCRRERDTYLFDQIDHHWSPNAGGLDGLIDNRGSEFRYLKDPTLQKSLRARLPLPKRQALFSKFAELTGEQAPWSLLHPFDDLSGTDMDALLLALEMAKEPDGFLKLGKDQRLLILRAAAFAYFKAKLATAK